MNEPTARKNILSLILISVLMLSVLFISYYFLKETILDAKENSELEKIKSVLPFFNNNPLDSSVTFDDLVFYTAKNDDSIVGYACKTYTEKGFNGRFWLLAGFLPDGTLYKTLVLEQSETAGLGDRMKTEWKDQFNGKNPTDFNLKVKKDGGDVDAISSATISSRAYCDAIEKAYISLMKNILKKSDVMLAANKDDTCTVSDINIIKKVLPLFDNDPLKTTKVIDGLDFYFATKKNDTIGYAVKSSARGYNGLVWILTGILPDGKVYDICILKSNESVNYGAKLNDPGFLSQFKGKEISKTKFEVKKDGGDVDAVSGATISSRAFCEALGLACKAFSDNVMASPIEVKKDSIVAPSKPTVYQFADKSIFNGVLPAFDNNPLDDFISVDGLDMYFGKTGGSITGAAVTTFSNKGYGGKIILLVGFTNIGMINSISVIQHNETAYMGAQITESEFKDQFNGKNPASFKLLVKDDGGDVDAISGSTISSRAFCDAVQKAYAAFNKGMKK
jgi:Na+-translocating ferredoxin:NAD+ oxidoreductase subunit G